MEIAVRSGRSVKQNLGCGICCAHGGAPNQFTSANVSG